MSQHDTLTLEREQFKRDMKTIGERHGWSFGEGLEWDEARQDWGVSDMYTNWMWWAWLEARAALATPAQAQQSEQETELRRSLAAAEATISERNAEIIDLHKRLKAQAQQAGAVVAWRDLVDGETVLLGDRILSNGTEWRLIDEQQTHIVGRKYDGKIWRPTQRIVTTPPAPAQPEGGTLEENVRALLGSTPPEFVVHCREGGGHEDVRGTLAITWSKLLKAAQPVQGVPDGLEEYLRGLCAYHASSIACNSPEVKAHLGDINRWLSWLTASPTPPAQQPEAVPSEQARWCAYVGGMVAHWVKSEPDAPARLSDDEFEAAIAGIIERRLWALRREPAQQPAGDVVRDAERYRWLKQEHADSCKEDPDLGTFVHVSFMSADTHDLDAAIDAALASSARKGE